MNIKLLKKYREIANSVYVLRETEYQYPRCRYRWLRDVKELLPCYEILENGTPMYFQQYKSSIFYDINVAKQELQYLRRFHISHLATKEKLKRC